MPDLVPVREAAAADYQAIGRLIFDAIHTANNAYTPEQRQAWAPKPPSGPDWTSRLAQQEIWVGEAGGDLAGVMTLAAGGYVDLAYIRADCRGSGLFRRLYGALETSAKAAGEPRLWTHASLMAEPAFSAMGFSILRPDPVEKDGQTLRRFEMEKWLRDEEIPS